MSQEDFSEPDWFSWTPVSYYGNRFGLIVTLNTKMFWDWNYRGPHRHLHFCAGPLEVSAWMWKS